MERKGPIVTYPVPQSAVATGKIRGTWGDPELTEIWLIKQP